MAISDYSTTPASNTSLSGIDISGTTGKVKDGDNAIRQIMADIKAGVPYLSGTNYLMESTDAGATAGPVLEFYRNSATPAASDITGKILFNGEDSAGNTQEYASIQAVITDPTSTSEDSTLDFYVQRAGVRSLALSLGAASAGPITAVRRQIFTSSGTYTPNATMVYALIECWGSGGAGGGVVGSATGTRGGGGGGAGGYSASIKTAAQVGASQTVTIGAGGTGSSGAAGGAGGATSVGSLVVANGGSGGGLNDGSTGFGAAGAGGSVGTGDDARLGGPGFPGNYATITTVMAMGGQGGGPGGASGRISLSSAGAGNNANVAGGGGSGGAANGSASSVAGGSGGGGIVVITEYCSA